MIFPPVEAIEDQNLEELCRADEAHLRQSLGDRGAGDYQVKLAYLPTADVMRWHHAREEFLASRLQGRMPKTKGALVYLPCGKRVWMIWTRTFQRDEVDNTLFILRAVVEGAHPLAVFPKPNGDWEASADGTHVMALAACLDAARKEAEAWNMSRVEVWNPSPCVLSAARICEPAVKIQDRDKESIASLLWYGPPRHADIQWVCNEKFAWC